LPPVNRRAGRDIVDFDATKRPLTIEWLWSFLGNEHPTEAGFDLPARELQMSHGSSPETEAPNYKRSP
jgi:hypothetical protein